jgi:diaminopimelate epimerase
MAAKKKSNKKRTNANRTAGKKLTSKKKTAKKQAKKPAKKPSRKQTRNRELPAKKAAVKVQPVSQKKAGRTRSAAKQKDSVAFSSDKPETQSGGQSGDLQGLSGVESADSESVGELLEEGNAFEADVVTGVEAADNADEREVRTHEVPEDDVPGEYSDEE